MQSLKEGRQDTSGGEVYTAPIDLGLPHSAVMRRSIAPQCSDAGASANLVGANWLNNHNAPKEALWRPLAKIAPALSSFRCGDGRVGEVHRAAMIPILIAGHAGRIMAYVVDVDIPAIMGKEAIEIPGGRLNFCEQALTPESLRVDIPREMNDVGHYLLRADVFPGSYRAGIPGSRTKCCGRRVVCNTGAVSKEVFFFIDVTPAPKMHPAGKNGPPLTLSCLEMKQFEHGGLRPGGRLLPSLRLDGHATGVTSEKSVSQPQQALPVEPASCEIAPPIHNALTSSALGEASGGEKSDSKEIARRLHVNWGRAPAQQLERTMAEAERKAGRLIPLADYVVKECDVCRACFVAPAILVAGTSSTSFFNDRVQVDLLSSDDLIILHVLDLFSRYSVFVPGRPKNPEEVRDAFSASWIAVFGKPKIVQMDEGG